MAFLHVSACPKCGAPIYEQKVGETPVAHFTCECRLTLPTAMPEVDGSALETTVQADRRHLARQRVEDGAHAPGDERVGDA